MRIYTKIAALILALAGLCSAESAYGQNLIGEWSGDLKVTPQVKLTLVFNIKEKAVSLDSPDQGAYGIPGDLVFLSEDSVCFKVPNLMMEFSGALKDSSLVGEFQQGGMKIPLEMTKTVTKLNRPQTPQPPFPYTTEELKITTSAGTIAGTLTIPEKADKNTPLAVLVTGSGQQNRDEEIFEHKPFAVIADYLAQHGIATFRYDDRGIGESTGDVLSATTADFAADAEAAVDYLRKTGRFGKTGILGHSEGGLIAYMLGAKPATIDFVVSVAGPAVKGSEILEYQNKMALLKAGLPEQQAEEYAKAAVAEQVSNPWMKYFVAYDPAADLGKLKIPTLIIYGEKDRQVPPSLNADVARRLAPEAVVMEFPQLNHLMQHAQTGDVSEYKTSEETISPDVLKAIADFIKP